MRHRGAVLLEVVVSLAVFVAAASLTLSAARNALTTLDRDRNAMLALDRAASIMAELEAGLVSIITLREEDQQAAGSFRADAEAEFDADSSAPVRYELDVRTQRTEFEGLSRVVLTVRVYEPTGDRILAQTTLRQLVALVEPDPDAYEVDDILDNLPVPTEDAASSEASGEEEEVDPFANRSGRAASDRDADRDDEDEQE